MNARWLMGLSRGNEQARQQVRERFRQELLSEQPKEGVQAALAAASNARRGLWQQLCDLLAEGAVANEAVWWALLRGLSHPKTRAQELAWEACWTMTERLETRLLADRLTCALVDLTVDENVTPCLLALLREATNRPCVELRATLEPLRSCHKRLCYTWPALAEDFKETQAVVEAATQHLKNLPLPAAVAPTAINLPLPATAQDMDGSEAEKEETNLWKQLKSKFRS
ncbi:hypothetical protein [Armatimonas sp.]|uniref:hypothetical protein n=1 Tax=Armatimonas sp. TaxID=1872638 RepID=UPI00286D6363|nr:hypothetical protein [Armatimonas sp.]